MSEHIFKVGGRYENRKGPYTVLSIDGGRMLIQWDSGEKRLTTIEVQRKIFENLIKQQGGTAADLHPRTVVGAHDFEESEAGKRVAAITSTNTEKESTITSKLKANITEIEHRDDLSDDEKVKRITHIACATCAGIAVQPIPFADIFILTPTQAYFGSRIGAIRGVPVTESSAEDLIKELIGVVGLGVIAQQLALGIWKLVTFGAGGLVTIPLVYGLTYAVMRVIDAYMSAKSQRKTLSDAQLKAIFKNALKEGKKQGQDRSK